MCQGKRRAPEGCWPLLVAAAGWCACRATTRSPGGRAGTGCRPSASSWPPPRTTRASSSCCARGAAPRGPSSRPGWSSSSRCGLLPGTRAETRALTGCGPWLECLLEDACRGGLCACLCKTFRESCQSRPEQRRLEQCHALLRPALSHTRQSHESHAAEISPEPKLIRCCCVIEIIYFAFAKSGVSADESLL